MLIAAKSLKGYKLDSLNGEIGHVKEFYFDDKDWTIRFLVADTGNWLKSKIVLISPRVLVSIITESENITVNLSKEQIEESPPLNSHVPVSRHIEENYYGTEGWPMYWSGSEMISFFRDFETRRIQRAEQKPLDCHLRSTHDVTGYHIEATDGPIGHVEDFIVDDETWVIRYLVIDTKNWGVGRKVLISPGWISSVSWNDSKVFVNLPCSTIEHAKGFTDLSSLNREYEISLYQHYQRPGYWPELPDDKIDSK